MRKILILIVLAAVSVHMQPQCIRPYVSFKDIKADASTLMNDTIAYLEYNFDKRKSCYEGKTIGDVINDLELPIQAFNRTWTPEGYLVSIDLLIFNPEARIKSLCPISNHAVSIVIEKGTLVDSVVSLEKKYPSTKWVPEHYEFFKDLKVESIRYNDMRKIRIKSIMERERVKDEYKDKPLLAPSDSVWFETLKAGSVEIKKLLEQSVQDRQTAGHLRLANGSQLSEKDIRHMELIPVEIFTMDTMTYALASIYTPIDRVVNPKTNEAVYYAARGEEFVAIVNPVFADGKWQITDYKPIPKEQAATLSDIYFRQRLPVYIIYVETGPVRGITEKFLVYTQNRNFRFIREDGTTHYFNDELVRIRNIEKSETR